MSSDKNPKVTVLQGGRAADGGRARAQARRAEKEQLPPQPDPATIMVRDLDGRIYFWNSSAEEKYGWSHRDAIGTVSHSLLRTIFPEPLDVINYELLNHGAWEGALIHTRADGSQVKVSSRWQLYRDADGRLCTVLEVNDRFSPVDPASAHLKRSGLQRLRRLGMYFVSRKSAWLIPCIAVLALAFLVWLLTHHSTVAPLH